MRALIVDEVYHRPYKSYDIAIAFQQSLSEIGIKCDITGLKGVEKLPQYDLAFYFLYNLPKRCKLRKGKTNIIYHSEQLPRNDGRSTPASDMRWKELKEKIIHFDHTLDFSFANVNFLKSQGYSAAYCPWGYSEIFDVGPMAIANESNSVSVLATLTGHRKKGVDFLRQKGVDVKILSNIYGIAPVVSAMRECKISLNLHNDSLTTFESGRVVCLSMSNNIFVVSEPYEDEPIPLKNNEHLIVAPQIDMPDIIKFYLSQDEKRKNITQHAYEFVKTYYTMTQNIIQALTDIKIL